MEIFVFSLSAEAFIWTLIMSSPILLWWAVINDRRQ